MTDLADMGIQPDPARSTWAKVKVFPKNVEVEVSAVFAMRGGFESMFFGDDVPDARGAQVVIHYGMSMLPASSYKPRLADDRVGHFLSTVKDFSQDLNETPKMRYVTRWNLEKTNPEAEKSPPKQPIIFWIERTVPREYRQYVREGILEWNKAFEKIGFIDAIQARDQQGDDEFDPEDIRYNTFRWISTSRGFAVGPSRTNPKTGEILDADIIFDEGMIRDQREEYLDMAGVPAAMAALASGQRQRFLKHYAADLPALEHLAPTLDRYFADKPEALEQFRRPLPAPEQASQLHLGPAACAECEMGPGMQRQLAVAAALLAARGEMEPGGKVPEKLLAQAVKEIVMHEVGHTLGLRHNFKASSIYSARQINDPEFTAKHGNSGSVMDYLPANIVRKGEKQGDYFTPTIGPYDYWAIEYAYKPLENKSKEKEELAKIAGKVSDPELAFGTDEDLMLNPDPRIQLFDLGEPLEYASNRIQLVRSGIDDLQDRVVAKGEGWQRARRAFDVLLGEMFRAASLATCYVTGEYTCRDHRDDKGSRAPMKPIELGETTRGDPAAPGRGSLGQGLPFQARVAGAPGARPVARHRLRVRRIVSVSAAAERVAAAALGGRAAPGPASARVRAGDFAACRAGGDAGDLGDLPRPDRFYLEGAAAASRQARGDEDRRFHDPPQPAAGPRGPAGADRFGAEAGAVSFGDLILFDSETPPPADARSLARQHLREIDGRIGARSAGPRHDDAGPFAGAARADRQDAQRLLASQRAVVRRETRRNGKREGDQGDRMKLST